MTVHRVTIKRFLSGEVRPEALKDIIRASFSEIKKNKARLFSPQTLDWGIKSAQKEIITHKVALSSDHAGVNARVFARKVLDNLKVEYNDFGPSPYFKGGLDFPVWSVPAIEALDQNTCTRAILCCGSGTGVMITANSLGHRATKGTHPHDVVRGREHNNIDILTIGERMVADYEVTIKDVVKSIILFLSTPFIKDPQRYQERIIQVDILRELMVRAQIEGSPVTELKAFVQALRICPELADMLVVDIHEAVRAKDYQRADDQLVRYLTLGGRSRNFTDFLRNLEVLLLDKHAQHPIAQKMISRISRYSMD